MQNIKTFFRMFHQLMSILNKKQKRQAFVVAVLTIICALLEMLGVGVVLPFVFAMLQPEMLLRYEFVQNAMKVLHFTSERQLLVITALLIILIYFLKNGFIIASNYIQLKFRNKLERDLSVRMLKSYIYKPYQYFLNVNSAEIIRGITGDIAGVAATVDGFCSFANEGLTCILLSVLLIVINPVVAVGLLILAAVIALLMVVVLRRRTAVCGERCRYAFAERQKQAYQAINGIKEIQVMKRQGSFLKYFENASDIACKYNTQYLWIAKLPNRVVETAFITGLVVLVMFNVGKMNNLPVLIAQMSAMAVAATRILPSISNIANAMNSLVYQRPALENAYDNLRRIEMTDSQVEEYIDLNTTFSQNIVIRDIYWKYREDLPNILEGLNMTIKPGEAVGLIGESGAGKTTLADVILGLFSPQKGEILVDGKDIHNPKTQWHKLIGYVPQTVFLIDDTIRNNILFGVSEKDADDVRIWEVLKQAQLKKFVENLPEGLDTILGERGVKISGGQRQRIAIARALYYDPEILVLDEATSALDNDTENAIMESINLLQGEKTLIIVAHRLSTIEKCDHVYKVENGKAIRI